MTVGDVVEAEVVEIFNYGIFFQSHGVRILVTRPEVSWAMPDSTVDRIRIGDRCAVLLLRYNPYAKDFAGSIRRLDREGNPYRKIAELSPDAQLRGRVKSVFPEGVVVVVDNGAIGLVRSDLAPNGLREGEEVDVQPIRVDVNEGTMSVVIQRRQGTPPRVSS